jgi:integrase
MKHLEPLPSGNVRLRIQVRGRSIKEVFATEREALAARDAILREIADDHVELIEGSGIRDYRSSFLASRKGHRAYKDDVGRWDNHVAAHRIGRLPPDAVTPLDVLHWLDELKAKQTSYDPKTQGKRESAPLSWQSRKHCLNLLRRFFVWAIPRGHARQNPALGLRVAREDGDEDEGFQKEWYLDVAEQAALFEAVDGPERHIVAFALGTGLRLGELLCLHLSDVHVDGNAPHVVVRFGSYDPDKGRFRPPKGKRGEKKIRTVPLFGMALEAAREWLAGLRDYAPSNPRHLFFPTPKREPSGKSGDRGAKGGALRTKPPRSFLVAAERLGVLPRIGRTAWWHLLRHSCASSLVAGWWGERWTLDEVRSFLGHSSVKVTEQYAHLAGSVLEGTAARAHTAWQLDGHAFATTPKNSVKTGKTSALLSRGSQVRILPGAPANFPGVRDSEAESSWQVRGKSLRLIREALQAFADGSPDRERLAVDALSVALEALHAAADADQGVA